MMLVCCYRWISDSLSQWWYDERHANSLGKLPFEKMLINKSINDFLLLIKDRLFNASFCTSSWSHTFLCILKMFSLKVSAIKPCAKLANTWIFGKLVLLSRTGISKPLISTSYTQIYIYIGQRQHHSSSTQWSALLLASLSSGWIKLTS